LRKVLEVDDGQECIATVSKRGYRFVLPVTETTEQKNIASEKTLLAVLPFENLSSARTQEYFSDGLKEEMITQLSRLNPERLGVIARTSAMRYKGSGKSVRRIGQELGVACVLEGSVLRAGRRVRITAQLIQVSDQTHLWARKYERGVGDILAIQSDVATAIASEIKIKLAPQAEARLERTAAVEPRAYEAYLRGRHLWNQRTGIALRESSRQFGKSIKHDPGYAPAYARDGGRVPLAARRCIPADASGDRTGEAMGSESHHYRRSIRGAALLAGARSLSRIRVDGSGARIPEIHRAES
jgi:TolB-like protein